MAIRPNRVSGTNPEKQGLKRQVYLIGRSLGVNVSGTNPEKQGLKLHEGGTLFE